MQNRTPTVLDTTKNKTRLKKLVEIMDTPKVSNIDKPSHPKTRKIIEILDAPEIPVNTADQGGGGTKFNRINKLIQIQDPENTPLNEPPAICQTPIGISTTQKNKIPGFAGKKFESLKTNDKIKTSANRKGHDKKK